jgi:Na+-translocating ferredoxin:NAD+ oxidoreductase RnfE subunit
MGQFRLWCKVNLGLGIVCSLFFLGSLRESRGRCAARRVESDAGMGGSLCLG